MAVDSTAGATVVDVYREVPVTWYEDELGLYAAPQQFVALDTLAQEDIGTVRRRDIYRVAWPMRVNEFYLFALVPCVYLEGASTCTPGDITFFLATKTRRELAYIDSRRRRMKLIGEGDTVAVTETGYSHERPWEHYMLEEVWTRFPLDDVERILEAEAVTLQLYLRHLRIDGIRLEALRQLVAMARSETPLPDRSS